MTVNPRYAIPLRLRLLLALIAAAGAGVYLTYSGIARNADKFISAEAGDRLFAQLNLAASLMESEVNSGIEKTRMTAARTGLRQILQGARPGGLSPADRAALLSRLADAAGASKAILSIDLMDQRGTVVAAIPAQNIGSDLSSTADFRSGSKGIYVSAPRGGRGILEFDVTAPVPAAEATPGAAPAGALRLRLKSSAPPWKESGDTAIAFSLGRRQGNVINVTGGAGGNREIPLKSPEAAPFLPALEGQDGFTTLGTDDNKAIYAFRRLAAPDWVMTAGLPYAEAAGRGTEMLKLARINAALAFSLLAITAFFAVGLIMRPLTKTSRAAASLLEDCGNPEPESDTRPQPELIDQAISAASEKIRAAAGHGEELTNETETLREEKAALKYQNAELKKLNAYLSERETKISELKKEIAELREKVGGGV